MKCFISFDLILNSKILSKFKICKIIFHLLGIFTEYEYGQAKNEIILWGIKCVIL